MISNQKIQVFPIAVFFGALILTITNSFPGGLSGGSGFLLGFLVIFVPSYLCVLYVRSQAKLTNSEERKSDNDNFESPNSEETTRPENYK